MRSEKDMSQVKTVKTACAMGVAYCGVNAYVENGKIVGVAGMQEHPLHTLCAKAHAIPELAHSPERLTNPLRKVDGKWKEISWDEAFAYIADNLADIKEKYGARAVALHAGVPYVRTHTLKIMKRFSDLYGTPNYTTGRSLCFFARSMGHGLTCGAHIRPSFTEDARCMVVWGTNPSEGWLLWADAIWATRKRGAKLIVVDPRATPLAKEADIHIQIRPGTDCALALGLLNVIISEQLYDKSFVKEWTIGFDKLAQYVKEYPPERVEEITWVPAREIRNMARMYATNKPASTMLGITLDHCTNGIQAIRAITTLIAITGNLDIPGGNVYHPQMRQSSTTIEGRIPDLETSVGADYPLFSKFSYESTATPLTDAILKEKPYPIKALLVAASNPALTWPNTNKVVKAFQKLDLLVVIDIFMTETAKLADIVLPTTTFLERQDMRDYGRDFSATMVTDRVIDPVGNSMEDWKIWAELGKRMGYAEYFPWKDTDELFEYLLGELDVSLDYLKQTPGVFYYAEREFQKYLKDGFNTPSGKVEIYSEEMAKYGYDPIPTFHEPAESPVSRPDLAKDYPLILISGTRTKVYLHSQHRNLPSLRKLVPEPLVEINPQTASILGIADGDMVKVESLRGSIELKAKFTEDIHPEVISIQQGWSEANVNHLTDDEARDPVSAYPGFKSVMCRVIKAGK